jgi:hypothetical protein
MRARAFLAVLAVAASAHSQDAQPPDGKKCLTEDQYGKVVEAIKELDGIKKSEMTGEFSEPLVIVHDWDGRVYVNGGDGKPLYLKVKVGTVDRTLAVQLPTSVFYREKPPDPMFRLRIRAQAGVLLPDVWKKSADKASFLDAGIGWDFFHIGPVNLAVHTGVSSAGGLVGVDLTKNWGLAAGYSLVYRDFHSGALVGTFFSFN